MGFAGWGRRCELVIQSSQVDQDCTDFPVLVHEDSLPSEIFDADGSYPALNGGGDLRFSTDQAGDSQIPCEVESFVTDNDPANGKSAAWVKRTLSSVSNTSIWIFYNKAGESQPAETDAYGKHAVWDSNFVMVQHMAETPPGTIYDSTSNSNDGTTYNMDSADQVAGQIDGSLDFDGSNDYVGCGQNSSLNLIPNTDDFTLSAWINIASGNTGGIISRGGASAGSRQYYLYTLGSDVRAYIGGTLIGSGVIVNDNSWHHIIGVNYDDAGTQKFRFYVDGVVDDTIITSGSATVALDTLIGARRGSDNTDYGYSFNGLIDEVRISNTARTAGWIETEYNNQNAPGTFLVEGTPESPGVGVTISIFMQNMRGGYNLMSRGGFIN